MRGPKNTIHKKSATERVIPQPDVTVAQVVLLALAKRGRLSFREIVTAPSAELATLGRTENSFYTALARLKHRRRIVRTEDRRYELTPTGEYAALKAYVRKELVALEGTSFTEKKRGAWDGKWRIVIFDIPESKRPLRDYTRGVLKRLGCREFQRSMWIYPFKLPPFVAKFFDDPQIRKYVRLITAYDIDYDDDIRRKFRIS